MLEKTWIASAAFYGLGALFLGCASQLASAQTAIGADTKGGAVSGAAIIKVTNLNDAGTGSLRAALVGPKPKIIIFEVGGTIRLKGDLKVTSPYVTIAGQTAPGAGITLVGAPLRIRTHDVIVQHLAVRPGPAATAAENDNQDSISIDGSPNQGVNVQSFNVLLENVSATWSVDEAVSLWFETTKNVTIRNSIVAEALNDAGHPKGTHSMGLLVGPNIGGVEIVGNLLASNVFRNPAISQGASVFFANNYIYNPGQNASHFYDRQLGSNTTAAIMNNVYEAGVNSKKSIVAVLVPKLGNTSTAKTTIFNQGNAISLGASSTAFSVDPAAILPSKPPFIGRTGAVLPASSVKSAVLRYAGSRPAARNLVDATIISAVTRGTERVVDVPPLLSAMEKSTYLALTPPSAPFAKNAAGQFQIEAWLCAYHLQVGGQRSARCP